MSYSNLISTSIPKEDIKEILGAIDFINEKLHELVILTDEEKAALPNMHKDTIKFVSECMNIADKHPEIVTANVDVPEIKKDYDLVKAIQKINDPLLKMMKRLEDSALLAESEAYLPSLAIYNSMQHELVKNKSNKGKIESVS